LSAATCGSLLNVLAAKVGQALHVLDRFHITLHLNQRGPGASQRERPAQKASAGPTAQAHALQLLRRQSGARAMPGQPRCVGGQQALATASRLDPEGCFEYFWHYKRRFGRLLLGLWVPSRDAQSARADAKIARCCAPMRHCCSTVQSKGEISNGPVEGPTTKPSGARRSYGFRHLSKRWNCPISHVGKAPRTGNPPIILLTR